MSSGDRNSIVLPILSRLLFPWAQRDTKSSASRQRGLFSPTTLKSGFRRARRLRLGRRPRSLGDCSPACQSVRRQRGSDRCLTIPAVHQAESDCNRFRLIFWVNGGHSSGIYGLSRSCFFASPVVVLPTFYGCTA